MKFNNALPTVTNGGVFDVSLNSQRIGLQLVACFINIRSRVTGIATGDQALFFTRELF